MKTLLRLRIEGMRVVEVDPDTIRTFRIDDNDDGQYMLTMANDSQEYILHVGNSDQCHMMLNKLHNIMDIHVIDIN